MKLKEYLKYEEEAILKNDPAIKNRKETHLYSSYKIMKNHYIASFFYHHKMFYIARVISEYGKRNTGIEIHPGATINEGVFIDHGTSVVIGETAIVGKNVIMFHGVTLGGLGNVLGKRHPTVEDNALIGSGAKILGNITIGKNSKVGANAVVLKDVPSYRTAVGVPARIVKKRNRK